MAKSKSSSSLTRNKPFLDFLRYYQPEEVERRALEEAETRRVRSIILESGLFDLSWYRAHYPDLTAIGIDPVIHYITYGASERRDPGPHFSTARYLADNPALDPAVDNPLHHFIVHGDYAKLPRYKELAQRYRDFQVVHDTIEGSPYFDSQWYLDNNPDVAGLKLDPAEHYITYGAREERRAGPEFDTKFYLDTNPDVVALGVNPLYHFIKFGRAEGRIAISPLEQGFNGRRNPDEIVKLIKASGLFDAGWYLRQNPDVERAGLDPAEHYVRHGAREGRHPNANFMTQFYASQMTDEEQAVYNAFEHYILLGRKRGILPGPSQMQLAQALPAGRAANISPDGFSPGTIAIMAHVFYEDMCPAMAKAFAAMPYPYDLLVSTDSAAKRRAIETAFFGLPNLHTLDVRVTANRGRDIAPLVVEFAANCLQHDYVLHVHSKKSPYGDETHGWFDHCLEHLLHSPLYIDSLFRRFAANPKLGIVFPPPFPGIVKHMHWAEMRPAASQALERIGVPSSVLDAFPVAFPAGSMMWFRPAALKPLFQAGLRFADFPDERGQTNDTLAHVIERLFFYVAHHQGYSHEALRPAVPGEYFLPRLIEAPPAPLPLPQAAAPEVSIVVPVFNQWPHTAACLASIAAHTDGRKTPYEVVIADDGSSDETLRVDLHFPGVRRIATPRNLGFLENCNHAATHCRGTYILFLNNDTQVQPGWLDHLVDIFRTRPDAAIAGSKLIYPDGTLQEAGGIIWKNGGGMNYGRGKNPVEAAYCYVKESDYVSGAALLVEAAFFRSCGGFDTRYSPAYYEDTDLAFQAREAGRKVYFQPASLVVHFEGQSHGTDTATGVKRHQVVNRERFRKKWPAVLAKKHVTGKQLVRARERSMGRKVIAIIDYVLPEYDRHAGARYTFSYMKLLLEQGFMLKFLCCKLEEERQLVFARQLEQLGIETHHPTVLGIQQSWNSWIAENADNVDAFWLNRPNTANVHMTACRQTGKPIMYFCHDLHVLRESREAQIRGDAAKAMAILAQEKYEIDLFRQASVAYTPSSFELEHLRGHGLDNVILHPVFLFDGAPSPRTSAPRDKSIIFVGGMRHNPNSDGVLWFLRHAWPAVLAAVPDARLHIVGTGAPVEIMRFAGPGVFVHGGVDDRKLVALYGNARAAILPLRYGAGVKGKLIEAFQHGVPVVSTSIGIEGVPGIDAHIAADDEPEGFAASVAAILKLSDATWTARANSLAQFGYANFSKDRGWESLREGLTRCGLLEPRAQ